MDLDERVRMAHGDAWQAEGRLRTRFGGGARELAGVRLSASGLPHPQWNNGDLVDAAQFDVAAARAWYTQRAHGFSVAIAHLDGAPVGTATAVRTDDRAGRCVGIFGVGVLAHARGRGIGAALTAWSIEESFEAGAMLAHLNPNSEPAARIYRRLGFRETAGFDIYVDL
jgi:ribosomal protein S18 acetylase RimI-like enzyme